MVARKDFSQGARSASVSGMPARILATLAAGWKSSASAKNQPSCCASASLTVVLPTPLTPIMTMIMVRLLAWGVDSSFADDFHQHALLAAAVELAVKDLFPGAEVELAGSHGDDDFPAHDLALHVGVGVIFPGTVVAIRRDWLVRGAHLRPER